jgi:hypothetical protein
MGPAAGASLVVARQGRRERKKTALGSDLSLTPTQSPYGRDRGRGIAAIQRSPRQHGACFAESS